MTDLSRNIDTVTQSLTTKEKKKAQNNLVHSFNTIEQNNVQLTYCDALNAFHLNCISGQLNDGQQYITNN